MLKSSRFLSKETFTSLSSELKQASFISIGGFILNSVQDISGDKLIAEFLRYPAKKMDIAEITIRMISTDETSSAKPRLLFIQNMLSFLPNLQDSLKEYFLCYRRFLSFVLLESKVLK